MPVVSFVSPPPYELPASGNNENANKLLSTIRGLYNWIQFNSQSFKTITGSPLASVSLVKDVELPGVRGRVRAVAGPVLTLGRADDARKFKAGDVVHAAQFPGGDGLDELRSGSVRLTAVNAGTGTLTASTDWASSIPDIAKGDWLCVRREDFPEYGDASVLRVEHGLKGTIWGAMGYLVINARDGVPSVRRIPFSPLAAQRERVAFDQRFVQLASVYACTADILFF